MADISDEQFENLIAALEKNSSTLSGASKQSAKNTDTKFGNLSINTRKINGALDDVVRHLGKLGGSADDLIGIFTNSLRGFVGGNVVATLIESGMSLANSYKEMTDIGQKFGGSMFDMAEQAGAAGLPLSDFAKMLQKNSMAASVMASQTGATHLTMGELQKSLRDSTREFGFYGMSLDQMSDLTSDYSETLRVQGRLGRQSKEETTSGLAQFAKDISDFSALTGKSRKEIAADTNNALKESSYLASTLTAQQQKAIEKTTAFLASFDGGKELSQMLTQSVGRNGAIFSDAAKMFNEAGQTSFLPIIDRMAERAKSGMEMTTDEAVANAHDMREWYKQNKEGLRLQEQAGNASAGQIIKMFSSIENLTDAEMAARLKTNDKMQSATKGFAKIQEALTMVSATFQEALAAALKPLEIAGDQIDSSPFWKQINDLAKTLGTTIGNFIAEFAKDPKAIQNVFDGLAKFGKELADVVTFFAKITPWVPAIVEFGGVILAAIFALGLLKKTILGISAIGAGISALRGRDVRTRQGAAHPHEPATTRGRGGKLGWAATALSGLAGVLGGGDCCDGLMSGLSGLTDRIDFHGERAHENATKTAEEIKNTAKPATNAAEKTAEEVKNVAKPAATEAEKLASSAAKPVLNTAEKAVGEAAAEVATHSAVSSIGKVAAKSVGELIPGIGLAMGGYFAYQRAKDGDYFGATIEALTGLASTVPGIGTAAAIGIEAAGQGVIIARDAIKDEHSMLRSFWDTISGWFHVTPGEHAGANTRGRGAQQIAERAKAAQAGQATPSADNPYKNLTDAERTAKELELSEKIRGSELIKSDPALLDKIDVQNDLNKKIAELSATLIQVVASGNKKNDDANKTMIRQQQYSQNQTPP